MKKVVISVLGTDRPGIVAAVTRVLSENKCNIEDVSQTILQTEFAGIFIASTPSGLQPSELQKMLQGALKSFGAGVLLRPVGIGSNISGAETAEPFVVTTNGSDRLGLVAGMAEVMARFGVNITALKAVFRGGDDPHRNTMIYEVDVPPETDQHAFRQSLRKKAADLALDLSIQHRKIFEAIHRV